MSTQQSLGYIGVGHMGGPMARRLLAAGHKVHIWGRDQHRLRPVLDAGAVLCASPAEIAERADVVFTCVTDVTAIESVALGADGIASKGRKGGLLIDTSTVSPDATVRISAELEKRCGMRWIDAPVSGGPPASEAGTLAIMAGGAAEDIERARPLFDHLGRVTRMGPVGSGQKTKLINQVFVFVGMAMVSEAYGLAKRSGLDVAALPKALSGGRADSRMLQDYWPRLVNDDFKPTSSIRMALKDFAFVDAAAQQAGASMPITALVKEMYRSIAGQGFAEEDINAFYRLYRQGGVGTL
jgi:3-hydroxyisobutyrate dehydrogenase